MSKAWFKKGDRVAWHPGMASQHGPGSVIRESALEANAPNVVYGEVVGVANDAGTHFLVELEGTNEKMTLTNEEIVKVAKE